MVFPLVFTSTAKRCGDCFTVDLSALAPVPIAYENKIFNRENARRSGCCHCSYVSTNPEHDRSS